MTYLTFPVHWQERPSYCTELPLGWPLGALPRDAIFRIFRGTVGMMATVENGRIKRVSGAKFGRSLWSAVAMLHVEVRALAAICQVKQGVRSNDICIACYTGRDGEGDRGRRLRANFVF